MLDIAIRIDNHTFRMNHRISSVAMVTDFHPRLYNMTREYFVSFTWTDYINSKIK